MTTSIQRSDALNPINSFAMQYLGDSTPKTSSSGSSLPPFVQQLLSMLGFGAPQDSSAAGHSLAGGLPGGAPGHGHAFGKADHNPSPAHIKGAENWDAYRKGQDLVVTNEGKDGKGGGRSANVHGYFNNPEQKPVFINDQKQDFSGLQEGETFKHPNKNVADLSMPDDANKGDINKISDERRNDARKGLDENKKQLAELEEKLKGEQNPEAKADLEQAIEGTKKNVDFTQEQLKAAEARRNLDELKNNQQPK